MSSIWVTIKKELRSLVRDKKTLLVLIIFPFISAAMILFYGLMFDLEDDTMGSSYYDIGIDYDIDLTDKLYLNTSNLVAHKYDSMDELEEAYNNDDIEAYIHYNEEENKYYVYCGNDVAGMSIQVDAATYFQYLNSNEANIKLTEENIDATELYNTYQYELVSIEDSTNYMLSMIYDVVFTFVVTGVVSTASSVAVSATVTEKENGTLETVLSFPVSKKNLILGKFLANLIACIVSSLFELCLSLIVLIASTKIFDSFSDFNLTFSLFNIIISIIVCILSATLIAGLSIVLTENSKTSKEANTKLAFLSYVSMIPMFVNMFQEMGNLDLTTSSPVYFMIPVVGHVQMLIDLFQNNFSIINFISLVGSSVILGLVIIFVMIKIFKSERVLFGD